MQGGHGVVGVVWSHWFGAALEGQNFLPRCAGHGLSSRSVQSHLHVLPHQLNTIVYNSLSLKSKSRASGYT